MKRLITTVLFILAIGIQPILRASISRPNFILTDKIELSFDKDGKLNVKTEGTIQMVRLFNQIGTKFSFKPTIENCKEMKLPDTLEKGVWYVQITTGDGEKNLLTVSAP
jgi:hypothetical protein